MKVLAGVSGFSYSSWIGRFYPVGTKNDEFLGYYSRHLGSVEINSSFYAAPSAAMVRSWSAKTDAEFRFAFKAPRLITHILKLGKGAPEASEKLSSTLGSLGQRRGPILFQLPPFSKLDANLLKEFLSGTTGIGPKAFEFRHPSWFTDSTYRLLEDHDAGFCIAETEDLKPIFKVTAGSFAYFRLRKDTYDDKTIDKWHEKIAEAAGDVSESYVYLRHDETGENALLAQRLSKNRQEP